MIEFIQQVINGLGQGSIYALIALGYTMVFGVLRFINFAHGDVFMLGAFAGFYIGPKTLALFGTGPSYPGAFAVLVVAMVLCAAIGIVIEKLCYRPLRERPKLTVLITAIGVSLFLENAGQFVFGANPQPFPDLITDHAIEIPESWGALSTLVVRVSDVLVSLDSGRLQRRLEMRKLLDPDDATVLHVDDPGPATEEIRTAALQRALVARIGLDTREAHAHDDAIREAERAINGDVVVLSDPLREHLENAVATDEDGFLPGSHPLDVGIEHPRERLEVTGDERAVTAEEQLDARVTHAAESMEPRGLEPLTFWLPARRSPS